MDSIMKTKASDHPHKDMSTALPDSQPLPQSGAGSSRRHRPAPAKTFQCRGYGDCRMVFSRSEHLARHIRKHTGERPFTCHCGKQFSRLGNLRQHAQTAHPNKQEANERMMRELCSAATSRTPLTAPSTTTSSSSSSLSTLQPHPDQSFLASGDPIAELGVTDLTSLHGQPQQQTAPRTSNQGVAAPVHPLHLSNVTPHILDSSHHSQLSSHHSPHPNVPSTNNPFPPFSPAQASSRALHVQAQPPPRTTPPTHHSAASVEDLEWYNPQSRPVHRQEYGNTSGAAEPSVGSAYFSLIKRSADVTAQSNDGETPLHLALQKGQVDVARMLIERGADVTTQDRVGQTPLHLTAEQGDVAVAELLLECGADIDARDKMDKTPLHAASERGNLDLIRLLLDHNADILALNHDGHTFLDAAWARGHQEIVDINARYEDGQTALHIAAHHGDPEFIRWLIHRKMDPLDPNAEDKDQETPLFPASRNGKLEATRLLLDAGADANHRDWQEMTPLHGASEKGHVAVTQLLLDRSATVNAMHVYEWTPLHLASQAGKGKAAEVLLGRGAMVNAKNDSAWTPLHIASQKGHLDVVKLLLTNNADVNIRNEDGEDALHLAAFYGHLEIAQVLLKNGAFLDSENKEGKTAWDLALKEGHLNIAQLLRPSLIRELGGQPIWEQQVGERRMIAMITQ